MGVAVKRLHDALLGATVFEDAATSDTYEVVPDIESIIRCWSQYTRTSERTSAKLNIARP